MKISVVALVLFLTAGAAVAQTRPSTLRMTCAQAQGLVASRGAVVLSTGPYTYDRYVSSHNYCEINEVLNRELVPTADVRLCFVGYSCRSSNLDSSER